MSLLNLPTPVLPSVPDADNVRVDHSNPFRSSAPAGIGLGGRGIVSGFLYSDNGRDSRRLPFRSKSSNSISLDPRLNSKFVLTPLSRSVGCPDWLLDGFKPIADLVGMTRLKRFPYLKFFSEVQTRKKLIIESVSYLKDNGLYTPYVAAQMKVHSDFVDECITRLDIINTIDHPLDDDTQYHRKLWNSYLSEWPAREFYIHFGIPLKPKAFVDSVAEDLIRAQCYSRQSFVKQRLFNELHQAHQKGWYIVFDTLTLSDDQLFRFYGDLKRSRSGECKEPISEYIRSVGRKVAKACGMSSKSSYTDVYKYFIAPEYGSLNGRLHWHVVHLMAALPDGTRDPNIGARVRVRRELSTLKGLWSYGFNAPISVRYSGCAFSRDGWLWPVDKNNKPLDSKPLLAIVNYVSKYVNKSTDIKLHQKFGDNEKWLYKVKLMTSYTDSQLFRVRMSRGFGMTLPTMRGLSDSSLIQLTQLDRTVTPISKVLSENAKKEMCLRMGILSIANLPDVMPNRPNMLKLLRDSIKASQVFSLQNFIDSVRPSLKSTDISSETRDYIDGHFLSNEAFEVRFKNTCGSK